MKKVIIKYSLFNVLEKYARANPNIEVCGILKGKFNEDKTKVICHEFEKIENVSERLKIVDYVMNPNELMSKLQDTSFINKSSKKDWVAIWHTHPSGVPIPSQIDLDRAEYNVVYFITAPNLGPWGEYTTKTKAYHYNKEQNKFDEIKIMIL